jgi:hypothetical protein
MLRLSNLLHTDTIDRTGMEPRSDWPQLILLTTSLFPQKYQENALIWTPTQGGIITIH